MTKGSALPEFLISAGTTTVVLIGAYHIGEFLLDNLGNGENDPSKKEVDDRVRREEFKLVPKVIDGESCGVHSMMMRGAFVTCGLGGMALWAGFGGSTRIDMNLPFLEKVSMAFARSTAITTSFAWGLALGGGASLWFVDRLRRDNPTHGDRSPGRKGIDDFTDGMDHLRGVAFTGCDTAITLSVN